VGKQTERQKRPKKCHLKVIEVAGERRMDHRGNTFPRKIPQNGLTKRRNLRGMGQDVGLNQKKSEA